MDMSFNTRWGLLDSTGKILVNYIFEQVKDFSDGFAAVRQNKLWGFIDKAGNFVIEPQFTSADSFVGGLAWASDKNNNKQGYINTKGEFILDIPKADKVVDLRLNRRVY